MHTDDVTTFHQVELDGLLVEAFGDGEMGSYEFRVIDHSGLVLERTNVGYGQVGLALFEGLAWVLNQRLK